MSEIITSYVFDEALIVVPMLWVIGMMLKNTPRMKDWLIPYFLLVIGVTTTMAMLGLNVDAIIQGVLVSGAAVFGNELVKQVKERNDIDE